AIRRFQLDAGIKQTGEHDAATIDKLVKRAQPPEGKNEKLADDDKPGPPAQGPPPPKTDKLAVREYHVTTNTHLHLALPAIHVTVRVALFMPPRVSKSAAAVDGETWTSGKGLEATFEVGAAPPDKAAELHTVVSLDGKSATVKATKKSGIKSGVAFTDVHY